MTTRNTEISTTSLNALYCYSFNIVFKIDSFSTSSCLLRFWTYYILKIVCSVVLVICRFFHQNFTFVSGAAEHPPQGNYQSHTTLIGTSGEQLSIVNNDELVLVLDSRARSVSALGGVTPVREQLQYALEVSSIMCGNSVTVHLLSC